MAARRGPVGPAVLAVLALLGPGRPLPGARAALNLQELSELKYGLEILAEPVLAGQRRAEDVVTVASKFKQRYECRLPPAAVRRRPDPEEEAQLYNGSGVAELLRPMAAAPCLVKTKDWWTYEFCYGKHIQQYHVEDSEIKGDVLFLGYYQSAFDWDDETAKASQRHRLKRYHSQSYANGSRCDLTGRAREAEVRFLCEEGAGDYIARVDEPQSCSYVLTVHTTRICHHPFLRPPAGAAPQPILCQPALSPAQYVQYVRAQVSNTKRKVEEISEELKTLDTRLRSEREAEPPAQPPAGSPAAGAEAAPGDEPDPAQEAAFRQQAREAGGRQDSARVEEPTPEAAGGPVADAPKKIHFKVIRSPSDLLRFIEELKESARKAKEKTNEEEEAEARGAKAPPGPQEPRERAEEEEEEEEEEGELLGGLGQELAAVLLPRARGAALPEEVEKEFDNIITEVEDELETEGLKGEFERRRASTSLASTLHRLLAKLEGPGGEEEEEEEEEEGGGAGRKAGTPPAPAEGRLRVRVSRMGPSRAPPPRPPPPKLRPAASEVRELLAQEGLRAEGKIEIKIVGPGGGEEEEEGQWLSEEDSRSLREVFLGVLLQGTAEAQRERRRQQVLEANYRLVWGGPRDPPPAPPDSEDPEV